MFQGSFTALVTPFKNGKVDEKSFQQLVEWQISEGTHGLVPVGTTGESPTLSHDEHKAVIDTCKKLEKQGMRVTYLPVQKDGRVSLDELRAAITDKTILITIMTANNEIGVLQPIAEIGAIAKEKGILFHTDAVQAVGKVPVSVNELKVDLLSLSAHKMYGPKGVGALYVRRRNPRVLLSEQISGGGHERGMRSGTLNVPGIVGLGKAAELCRLEMAADAERLRKLRDRLNEGLHKNLDEIAAFKGKLTTTEFLCRHIFDAIVAAAKSGALGADGKGLAKVRVTLHETDLARAWFEGPVNGSAG